MFKEFFDKIDSLPAHYDWVMIAVMVAVALLVVVVEKMIIRKRKSAD